MLKVNDHGRADNRQHLITIVQLSLRLRCTKKYRKKEILLLSCEFLQQLSDYTTPHVK